MPLKGRKALLVDSRSHSQRDSRYESSTQLMHLKMEQATCKEPRSSLQELTVRIQLRTYSYASRKLPPSKSDSSNHLNELKVDSSPYKPAVLCSEIYKTSNKEANRLTPISDLHSCEVFSHCTGGNLLYIDSKLRQTFYDTYGYCFTSSSRTVNHKPMSDTQTTT